MFTLLTYPHRFYIDLLWGSSGDRSTKCVSNTIGNFLKDDASSFHFNSMDLENGYSYTQAILKSQFFSLKVKLGWLYLYFHRLFPFFYTDISYSLVQRKQKWECVFPNINKQAWIYIIHHIIHVAFLIYPLICFLRFLKTPYGHYFLPMWKLPFTFC